MSIDHCMLLHPWNGQDFIPCFRETIVDAAIPLAFLVWAVGSIITVTYQYRKSRSSLYTPLKSSLPTSQSYGSTINNNGDTQQEGFDQGAYEEKSCQWSLYNWSRLLAFAQCVIYTHALFEVYSGDYKTDYLVEGSSFDLLVLYSGQSILWIFCSLLAFINLVSPPTFKLIGDEICTRLNLLYLVHFLIGLLDLRSFYIVYNHSTVSTGYAISFYTTIISLLLLVFAVNEERHSPTEPVITDTGRVLSGESWASLYSQFMFSWVNVMMKLGYKRTINDRDLIELPAANRTKNVLSEYRRNKQSTMWRSLAYTFRWPLLVQVIYSLVWSVVLFGPALCLNKIVKYIETPDTTEPVLTAFIYVFGLFITSAIQSLALQQALYIGRTLGIRIQAIVIGEVYGKSLRRRDTSSSNDKSTEKDTGKEDDSEAGDINNLLSVDAQKVGEMTAYIFFAYAYPLQIAICIAALYRLLGYAAFYGVLVMIITQPVTYWIGRKFEGYQKTLMGATDRRIKLVNELLGAIRIVKFFAWEKQLKSRVLQARDVELKAVRDRLIMFMWMMNSWFLIPIMIMVVVFYVFTLESALTASTAFTTLSLFNTFRAALDELPMIISFLLQARVSMARVVKFLDEDEVESVPQVAHPSGTYIGFVDNATFGWDDPKSSSPTPILKDLNIAFPQNKLSIVCGPTGSGKSTLLSSLLSETYRYSGSVIIPPKPSRQDRQLGGAASGIAYVAQTAWLQNCSIRDNILFGLDYDEDRYAKVLYMTALTRDLDILEYGDATEVGEKGVSLSGGQKQRLAIARAVYSNAETVILDDCLSAVDAHTAKHLYDNCIKGELMINRTIIMVTHYVGLCMEGASYIVSLKDGKVVAAGNPQQILQTGALGEELANAKLQQNEAQEELAEEGSIPSVPQYAKIAKTGEGSKLVKDEVRAEGGVPLSVYTTYFYASGGYIFWLTVLFFFCLTQATVLGQDYWLKVWSQVYTDDDGATTSTSSAAFVTSQFKSLDNGASLIHLASPSAVQQDFLVAVTNVKDPHSVNINYYLGVYFAIGMIACAVASIRLLILYSGSIKASRRIHAQLLDTILHAKVRFFDTTPLGRILNRFSADMETIDQEVSPQFSFLLFSVISTLMIVIVVSTVTPAFLIPGSIISVVFWMIGVYYLKTSRDLKRLNSVSRSPIYTQFHETVSGVATIRAFGAQERFVQDNYTKVDNNNRPFIWMWATNRWLHCRVEVLGAFVGFCTAFVLILSRNWVDAGLAGLSLSYALNFTTHMLWTVRNYAMNEMNLNAVERVSEYLDLEQEPPMLIPETMPRSSWPEDGSIQVNNLVVKYAPENPSVLRNVSFDVKPREKVAIVGRTGSGKSTFALSLFRFMEATSGTIAIDGVDISTLGLETLRSRLTIIPQDPILFSGTLRSNLDPFDQYDDATLWAAVKRSHLVNSHSSSNGSSTDITLESVVAEGGKNFSAGQRQLIAMARALVKKSSLIILDEATSSVDFETDRKIQETIRSEFSDSALLCVAHRLRSICDYDRVLVLDQGEVMEYDTPYRLMMKDGGIFQQMCQRSGEFNELLAMAQGRSSLI
ncbi:P-loop containing nucleoside triphosphate hydrolase protein [Chlamydoabsidia padenii]|nr:P-loop containing nucleoside triphosphate hydrolase protein [Chlamydoabsidia padenii]